MRNKARRARRLSTLYDVAKKAVSETARLHPESSLLARALLDPGSINPGRPKFKDTAAWLKRLEALPGKGNAEVGKRIFSHPRMALCSSCHRHSGRGNVVVGADVSFIAQQGDFESTLRSILEPHRDVAPQFFPTLRKLKDGSDFIGIMLRSSKNDVFRDLTGKERTFEKTDVLERTEWATTLMPSGLVMSLTDEELSDFLAFLRGGSH